MVAARPRPGLCHSGRMSGQPLPGILASLAPVLDHYGYLAVGAFVLVEDFGIPLPGETILIAASVYAGSGRLSIFGVALIALLAAVIGDNIGYAIGYFGGRALVLRFGKYVHLTSERLDRAERFFDRYGGLVVAGARFIEGLRQANGIVAGTIRMHWLKFLAFNALGAALWVGVWASIGYLAGGHITVIYNTITRYSLYFLIALGIVVAALIVRAVMRRRRRDAGKKEDAGRLSGGSTWSRMLLALHTFAGRTERLVVARRPAAALVWTSSSGHDSPNVACSPRGSPYAEARRASRAWRGAARGSDTERRGDACHDIRTACPLTEVWPR